MSVERHPLFLLFSVRLRLNAFLMPQNALPEFPGCHGTASDPKEKADQINPYSNYLYLVYRYLGVIYLINVSYKIQTNEY